MERGTIGKELQENNAALTYIKDRFGYRIGVIAILPPEEGSQEPKLGICLYREVAHKTLFQRRVSDLKEGYVGSLRKNCPPEVLNDPYLSFLENMDVNREGIVPLHKKDAILKAIDRARRFISLETQEEYIGGYYTGKIPIVKLHYHQVKTEKGIPDSPDIWSQGNSQGSTVGFAHYNPSEYGGFLLDSEYLSNAVYDAIKEARWIGWKKYLRYEERARIKFLEDAIPQDDTRKKDSFSSNWSNFDKWYDQSKESVY